MNDVFQKVETRGSGWSLAEVGRSAKAEGKKVFLILHLLDNLCEHKALRVALLDVALQLRIALFQQLYLTFELATQLRL